MFAGILFVLNIVLSVLVFGLLDRGGIISPASTRIGGDDLAALRKRARRSPLAPHQLTPEAGD